MDIQRTAITDTHRVMARYKDPMTELPYKSILPKATNDKPRRNHRVCQEVTGLPPRSPYEVLDAGLRLTLTSAAQGDRTTISNR